MKPTKPSAIEPEEAEDPRGMELCALVTSWSMRVSFSTMLRYLKAGRYGAISPTWAALAEALQRTNVNVMGEALGSATPDGRERP